MSAPNSMFRIAVVGFAALAIAMGVGRFAFTPLLPLMQDDGLVSIADGGVLASVHFLGYLLGAMAAGKLVHAPRMTLRVSLLVIAVSTLGMGLTENFALWSLFRWLSGVCSAFVLVLISNFYVRYLTAAGRVQTQGWVFSGVGAGIALVGFGTLAIMAAEAGSAFSWQIFGWLSLVGGVALSMAQGEEIPVRDAAAKSARATRAPLAWSVVIAYGAMGIGYIIPATYLPVMAREVVQSPLVFGWSWPIFGAAAFLSTLVSAWLHTAFSNRQIWAVSQWIMAAGLLLPALFGHIAAIVIAGICVGGTFMIITMAGMKEAHRIAGARRRSASYRGFDCRLRAGADGGTGAGRVGLRRDAKFCRAASGGQCRIGRYRDSADGPRACSRDAARVIAFFT